jgi:hypothetical protein
LLQELIIQLRKKRGSPLDLSSHINQYVRSFNTPSVPQIKIEPSNYLDVNLGLEQDELDELDELDKDEEYEDEEDFEEEEEEDDDGDDDDFTPNLDPGKKQDQGSILKNFQ